MRRPVIKNGKGDVSCYHLQTRCFNKSVAISNHIYSFLNKVVDRKKTQCYPVVGLDHDVSLPVTLHQAFSLAGGNVQD